MPKNSQKIGEANFKAAIFQEYFGTKRFTYMQEVSKIDFVITDKAERHILWAETKKDTADIVVKTQIDKNNFIPIYNRWFEIVKPSAYIKDRLINVIGNT